MAWRWIFLLLHVLTYVCLTWRNWRFIRSITSKQPLLVCKGIHSKFQCWGIHTSGYLDKNTSMGRPTRHQKYYLQAFGGHRQLSNLSCCPGCHQILFWSEEVFKLDLCFIQAPELPQWLDCTTTGWVPHVKSSSSWVLEHNKRVALDKCWWVFILYQWLLQQICGRCELGASDFVQIESKAAGLDPSLSLTVYAKTFWFHAWTQLIYRIGSHCENLGEISCYDSKGYHTLYHHKRRKKIK